MIRITPSLWLSICLCALLLALGAFPTITEPLLQFDRQRIESGEWWRLLSGQIVHYGVYHLLMNVAALALCGFVLLRYLSLAAYATLLLVCALGVGLGLYFLSLELEFYAGLSGVLHGLILAGLLIGLRATPLFNVAALLLVTGKLFQEQAADFDTSHALLPVPVAVDAHVYGAAAGFLFATGMLILTYLTKANAHTKTQDK